MRSLIEEHCSKEWQEFINFHKSISNFKAGQYILKEGQDVKGIRFIEHGKVKVVTSTYDNNERVIRLATRGDVLGHRGFAGNWKYPISCIALTECTISLIPIDVFKILCKSNAEFSFAFAMFMSLELRMSEEKIMTLPAKARVLRALIQNYEVFGFSEQVPNMLSFTLSRKDIASKAGTTYETVVRTLSSLNKNGIIKIINKNIVIPSTDKLYHEYDKLN